jgi:hypothetical protein
MPYQTWTNPFTRERKIVGTRKKKNNCRINVLEREKGNF